MLVRLDRIVIPSEELARPIPSLSNRQFVVSKVQTSAAEERATREIFWYREELLKRIRASWNEVSGSKICLRVYSTYSSTLDTRLEVYEKGQCPYKTSRSRE